MKKNKTIKVHQGRKDQQIIIDGLSNQAYLQHSLDVVQLEIDHHMDRYNPKEVETRIMEYFGVCGRNNMKPNVAGLALSMGVDRHEIIRWIKGENKYLPEGTRAALKVAYTLINSQMEDYMLNGSINPIAGIFLMKNNMGYTNIDQVVVSTETDSIDTNAIKEKYQLLQEQGEDSELS